MKTCPKCKENKPATLEFWYKLRTSVDGLFSYCKLCHRKASRERPRDNVLEAKRQKEWRANNKERHKKNTKEWYAANPGQQRAIKALRRGRILGHGFKYSLRKIYDECPSDKVVDHIVPLNGNNVSGLHVPWNLQYLTRTENARKSNSHDSN